MVTTATVPMYSVCCVCCALHVWLCSPSSGYSQASPAHKRARLCETQAQRLKEHEQTHQRRVVPGSVMRHVFLQNALSEVPPWTLIHSTTRKAFHQRSCFSCLPKNIWQISMLLLLWVRLTSKSERRVPTRSPWLQTLLHTWGHADLSIHPTTGYKFGVSHKYFSISVNSHRTQESTVFRSSFIIAKVYKLKSPKGRVRKSRKETSSFWFHSAHGVMCYLLLATVYAW